MTGVFLAEVLLPVLAGVFLTATFFSVFSFFAAVFLAGAYLAVVFFLASELSPSLVVFLVVLGRLLRRGRFLDLLF